MCQGRQFDRILSSESVVKVHRLFWKKRKVRQSPNLLWTVPISGGPSTRTTPGCALKRKLFERELDRRDSLAEREGFELPVPFRICKARLSAEVGRFSVSSLPSRLTENFFASGSARFAGLSEAPIAALFRAKRVAAWRETSNVCVACPVIKPARSTPTEG